MAWTVLSVYKRNGRQMARAQCACGAIHDLHLSNVKSGKSTQCRACRDSGNRLDIEARIAAGTVRDETTGCLVWQKAKFNGYPAMWVNGKQRALHRMRLEERIGRTLAKGEVACHSCDNAACLEPAHLFVGTQADNVADMIAKGRESRGERHGRRTSEGIAAQHMDRIIAGLGAPKKPRAKRPPRTALKQRLPAIGPVGEPLTAAQEDVLRKQWTAPQKRRKGAA